MQKWNSRVTYSPARVCKLWHRWELVKLVGAVKYFACRDCLSRRAEHHSLLRASAGVIQMDWVMHFTDSLSPTFPPRNPPPKRP
ncbi:hypothetical protein [Aeromonas sp. QDB25]|uniref:hypothetical protein n=1 Tax=Aeromonas sp. QDB25 TaxID=2989832 RepID=UPI0022E43490|nr:hypothetical protein [Aeromonas sp. QDB25]